MILNNIDEILEELDVIIQKSISQNNFLGIFAYVYLRTTAQIKTEIEQEKFEDNERLQKFDVLFANLYLDAYRNYFDKQPVNNAWKIAFDSKNDRLTIIQHVMMGMNAHINLDLAIAACEIMEGKSISDLENDFNKVNEILAGLLNEMQAKIGKVSKLMFLIDWIGKRTDENIINFSMVQARTQSWRIANELWNLEGEERNARIQQVDQSVTKISEFIKNPKSKLLKFVLKMVSRFEEKNIEKIVKKLRD